MANRAEKILDLLSRLRRLSDEECDEIEAIVTKIERDREGQPIDRNAPAQRVVASGPTADWPRLRRIAWMPPAPTS